MVLEPRPPLMAKVIKKMTTFLPSLCDTGFIHSLYYCFAFSIQSILVCKTLLLCNKNGTSRCLVFKVFQFIAMEYIHYPGCVLKNPFSMHLKQHIFPKNKKGLLEKISVSSVSVLLVEAPLSAEIPPHLLHVDNIVISIAHPQNTEVQNTEGQNEECQRS